MKKATFFLFPFFLFLISCQGEKTEKKVDKPAYVIGEDKMVNIMVDMHIVETASNLKVFPPDSAQQLYQNAFASIYLTHEVTKAKFDSSLAYYATQTDEMNVIYDKVLEELSQLESEVNSDQ
jgi:hypothetical protein